MTNFFNSNRGPVFAIDPTGGLPPATSAASSQASLGAGTGGTTAEQTAMFNNSMAQQTADYGQGLQMAEEKNKLQMMGDAALKVLKAVSIS